MVTSNLWTVLLSCASIASSQIVRNNTSSSSSETTEDTESTVTSFLTLTQTQTRPAEPPAVTGNPNDYTCCFVVLDHIQEVYWNRYKTELRYYPVNLTSYTTYMTPFPTTTMTSIATNVYTTNATFYWSTIWHRHLDLYQNGDGIIMANETTIVANPNTANFTLGTTPVTRDPVSSTVTAGHTIQSPDAYYIYDRIRIMTANAVADAAGEVVCVTDSVVGNALVTRTRTLPYSEEVVSTPAGTFTKITTLYETNSGFITPVSTQVVTSVWSQGVVSSYTTTFTTDERTVYPDVNTKLHEYFRDNATVTQDGIEIALETPFFYLPERGNLPKLTDQDYVPPWEQCGDQGPPMINYGYPPQELMEHLWTNKAILAQYPDITNCAPGGPPVTKTEFTCAAPGVETAGGDLTEGTIIMVTPTEGPVIPPTNGPPANPTDAPGPTALPPPQEQTLPDQPPAQTNQPPAQTNPPPAQTDQPPAQTGQPPVQTQAPGNGDPATQRPQQPGTVAPPQQQTQPTQQPPANTQLPNPPQNTQAPPASQDGNDAPNPTIPGQQNPPQNTQAPPASQDGNNAPNPTNPGSQNPNQSNGAQQPPAGTNIGNQPSQVLPTNVEGQPTDVVFQPSPPAQHSPITTNINGVETMIPPGQTLVTEINGVPTTVVNSPPPQNSNIGDLIESFLGIKPSKPSTQEVIEPTNISGVPNVVVTTEATIPISEAVGASGRTTVIDGKTNVVVTLSTHVPLVSNTRNSTTSSTMSSTTTSERQSASSTAPLQAPPAAAGSHLVLSWLHWNALAAVLGLYTIFML